VDSSLLDKASLPNAGAGLYAVILPTPIGNLGIQTRDNILSRIDFLPQGISFAAPPQNALTRHICQQLKHYFQHPHHRFDIEIKLEGTPFQKRVWEALRRIPAGITVSYKILAEQLETSPRAIGNACRANPIPVVIPCHRIVAKDHIGGYSGKRAGDMLDIKKWLLQHEKMQPA